MGFLPARIEAQEEMNPHTSKALHRRSLSWHGQPGMDSESAFFERWKTACRDVVDRERETNRKCYHRFAERRREMAKEYREAMKADPAKLAAHRSKTNARRRARALRDPQYRFGRQIRTRIWMAVHKSYGKKAARTFELIGCTRDQFLRHIEGTWSDGMTWENYGLHGWHIDHKTPLAHFDLTDPSEQRRAFHFTNTQALWAPLNLSKGANISRPAPAANGAATRPTRAAALAAPKRRATK